MEIVIPNPFLTRKKRGAVTTKKNKFENILRCYQAFGDKTGISNYFFTLAGVIILISTLYTTILQTSKLHKLAFKKTQLEQVKTDWHRILHYTLNQARKKNRDFPNILSNNNYTQNCTTSSFPPLIMVHSTVTTLSQEKVSKCKPRCLKYLSGYKILWNLGAFFYKC